MPFRETLLNLSITAVLVLIVVLAGILLKESRPGPVAAIPVHVADVSTEAGNAREVKAQFEIFPRPELVESRANEADTLRIRIKGEEQIFVLYFVDALEASMNHPQRVAEQGRYFGNASDKAITDSGAEAAAYVTDLLKTHPFHVLTRWEKIANSDRYYALIIVETTAGKHEYLANLLMKKGFARVYGVDTELPAGTQDIPSYMVELQSLARAAREQKAGIWSKVSP
ncbi:MAG: thermonuclease family protein [Prosthecobacter sp.]|nr:thermonuclease family protein [Prosthecobacter sp.]